MISTTANYIIVAAFGILFGVCTQVFALVTQSNGQYRGSPMKDMPRSRWVSLTALYAIPALLILIIRYTPVQMRWAPFLISFLVAGTVMMLIFEITKRRYRNPEDSR